MKKTTAMLMAAVICFAGMMEIDASAQSRLSAVRSHQEQSGFYHFDPAREANTAGLDLCREDFERMDAGQHSLLFYEQCGVSVTLIGLNGPFLVDDTGLSEQGLRSTFGYRSLIVSGGLGDEEPAIRFECDEPIAGVSVVHTDTGFICCELAEIEASFCSNPGHMGTGFGTGENNIVACNFYDAEFDRLTFFVLE